MLRREAKERHMEEKNGETHGREVERGAEAEHRQREKADEWSREMQPQPTARRSMSRG